MKEETKLKLGDWYTRFPHVFDQTENLALKLGGEYLRNVVFPSPDRIFKAFELCKYNSDLKVVILGQDPYNNTLRYNGKEVPYAQGYAFGNPPEATTLSPSLQKIKEAVIDSGHLFLDQTLENWQEQGVLLLNTALTVVKNKPTSHKELWADFTTSLVKELGKQSGLVWVLWGRKAQYYERFIDPNHCYVYTAEHPAAATYNNRPWNYDNTFNVVNETIEGLYGKNSKILW